MKSCVLRKIIALAFVSVCVFLIQGITHFAAADSLPGLVPSSLPAFNTSVNVVYTKDANGNTIAASYDGGVGLSNLTYPNSAFNNITNTTYSLTANFDASSVFQNGTVRIDGQIASLGINTTVPLMTADLIKFASDSSGLLVGFNTNNIVCNPDINAYAHCTTAESIYLELASPFSFSNDSGWSTTATAVTSVPVPAAVTLFGSGLIGLSGLMKAARRRKRS